MDSPLYLAEYTYSKYADIVSLQLLQLLCSQDRSKISYLGSVLWMNLHILADSSLLYRLHGPADKSQWAHILKVLQTSQRLQQLSVDQPQGLKQSMVY